MGELEDHIANAFADLGIGDGEVLMAPPAEPRIDWSPEAVARRQLEHARRAEPDGPVLLPATEVKTTPPPADYGDEAAEQQAEQKKAKRGRKPRQPKGEGGGEDAGNQATQLVAFVQTRCEVFHDRNRDVYVRDASSGHVHALDSRAFRDWLMAGFYKSAGAVARDQSVREAVATLTGIGRHDGRQHDVHIRVARHRDAYYIDLGEPDSSRAIEVTPGSWCIVSSPPVMFLRPSALLPLPEPYTGFSIDALWSVANIPETHRLLVLAWLVECLRPDTPFPVLELIGEAGSAKSTTQRILRRLVDENQCLLRTPPKSVEDIFVGAGLTHLYSLENVSNLAPAMQDGLCTLATGGGFAGRTLFTNKEESVIQVKRPTILNGIVPVVTAHDLVDRTITVDLPKLASKDDEAAVVGRFNRMQGELVGALLDLFADALAKLDEVVIPPDRRPRLVEFAKLGCALAMVLGRDPDDFLQQFGDSRREAVERTIESSPAASAIVDWLTKSMKVDETMELNELLHTILPYKPAGGDGGWPHSAKGLGNALRRAAPALRQLGIHVERVERSERGWRYRIRRAVN